MGRPLGQALPHRLYPPPLPKYKCSTLHSAWCGLPLRVGLALWRRRGLELLLAALALWLPADRRGLAAAGHSILSARARRRSELKNRRWLSHGQPSSPWRSGRRFANFQRRRATADPPNSGFCADTPFIHNPQPLYLTLVVQDGDSAKDSAHGGSGSDLCRQTCSGWTGGNLPRYLLPAHRPPRSRSDTLLFTLDAESFSGV